MATLWPGGTIGTLPGYDSSIATGVDKDGTVVGVAFELANTNHEQGFTWTVKNGMQPINELQNVGGGRDGVIAGLANDFQAAILKKGKLTELGVLGGSFTFATAVSGEGVAGPERRRDELGDSRCCRAF